MKASKSINICTVSDSENISETKSLLTKKKMDS